MRICNRCHNFESVTPLTSYMIGCLPIGKTCSLSEAKKLPYAKVEIDLCNDCASAVSNIMFSELTTVTEATPRPILRLPPKRDWNPVFIAMLLLFLLALIKTFAGFFK